MQRWEFVWGGVGGAGKTGKFKAKMGGGQGLGGGVERVGRWREGGWVGRTPLVELKNKKIHFLIFLNIDFVFKISRHTFFPAFSELPMSKPLTLPETIFSKEMSWDLLGLF